MHLKVKEAEEKAKKLNARREEEEKARKEEEEKTKKTAEEKTRREAQEKAKREAEERAKREAEEKAKSSPKRECILCYDNEPQVIFLPCGHFSLCEACCGDLSGKRFETGSRTITFSADSKPLSCPTCRQTVSLINKVFF